MCGANPEKTHAGDYSISGSVVIDGESKAGAYVRLLDSNGDFVAESPTSKAGTFAFFAAPGEWTVRLILPTGSIDRRTVLTEKSGATIEFAV
ncbi:MAG: DUF1416 domain-containing protein [Actinobacteria bacterium]|uniref:Unannotated protein n=1 Tax=freshwater metagenome TaxID=449393 RepID=A0A6J7DEJ8_9ZZZZ|nr:DUF1416 domain-containing protein [Actinomycetota bacterium]